jgi:hypothetical protein
MLSPVDFDREFLGRPCYRLRPPITDAEWNQFDRLAFGNSIFADLKSPASDLATASQALRRSFRKICIQVELLHCLAEVQPADEVTFGNALTLTDEQKRMHAEHFVTSRFRQDHDLPCEQAIHLYTRWIANSVSGAKRLAMVDVDFCSFEDRDGVRKIDLLSVLNKRRGHATELLRAVLTDAKSSALRKVVSTTELENEAALKAYKATGFEIEAFTTVFHFRN